MTSAQVKSTRGGITPTSAYLTLVFDLVALAALLWARWPSPGLANN